MTVRQLETFIVLAETKSFTEAANRLFLTQPAVSQQIQALEKDINCSLFVRGKNGLALTSAGKLLYDEAGSLLNHTNSVYRKLRQSSEGRQTVRTLCYLPALSLLPQMIDSFSQKHPEIFLSVSKADSIDNNAQLLFEQHDISVGFGDPEKDYGSLRFVPLYEGGMICLVHKLHPLAEKNMLSIPDLQGNTIYAINEHPHNVMLHTINDFLRSAPDTVFFPSLFGFYDGAVMASSGNCVCIVPDIGEISSCPLKAIPLDLPIRYNLGLYISKNAPQDVNDFCDLAQALCVESDAKPVQY